MVALELILFSAQYENTPLRAGIFTVAAAKRWFDRKEAAGSIVAGDTGTERGCRLGTWSETSVIVISGGLTRALRRTAAIDVRDFLVGRFFIPEHFIFVSGAAGLYFAAAPRPATNRTLWTAATALQFLALKKNERHYSICGSRQSLGWSFGRHCPTFKRGLKMKSMLCAISWLVLLTSSVFGQGTNYPKAKVSFEDFQGLVAEVEAHRASRLIDLDTFLKMSKEEGVIILDSRSEFRFNRIHVKGAKHLAFTDFTQSNLAKVIPNFDTKILIYCNNNFDGNQVDFASKVAIPRPGVSNAVGTQFGNQAKPLMMALNIPTYVNLYGYGYRNVYELHELVKVNDPRIQFEGSIVQPKSASPAGK